MLNCGYLQGRLVKDVDVRDKFSYVKLACNRNFKNADGKTETDFIDFKVFGDRARNMAKYLRKGSEIIVSFHVSTNIWDDRDGKRHYDTDLIIDSFQFTGGSHSKPDREAETGCQDKSPDYNYGDVPDGFRALEDDEDYDEDIPF